MQSAMSDPEIATDSGPRLTWLQGAIVWVARAIVRSVYKVHAVHPERMPVSGGVLMLPNHVSYMDALILASACPRHVRFVMWEVLYRVWWMNGFLRLMGTVPISPTRAKDAVRNVSAALLEGGVVSLFPEGQITRHGMINELRRGFELMARQGEAQVIPVYLDGLYGSIFSFQGGRFFTKWPKALRYPVSVYFGEPLPAKAGNASAIRTAMHALSAEAMDAHIAWERAGDDRTAFANALRVFNVEWHAVGDVLLCLEPAGSIIQRTVHDLARLLPGTKIIHRPEDAYGAPTVAFTSAAHLNQLTGHERLVFCWDGDRTLQTDEKILRGYLDADGTLFSTEVPNPPMPPNDKDTQLGRKLGALGRLLPGIRQDQLPSGLSLDEHGFVCVAAS